MSLWNIFAIQAILYQFKKRCGCMKETRMLPAQAANLVANSSNAYTGFRLLNLCYHSSNMLLGSLCHIWVKLYQSACILWSHFAMNFHKQDHYFLLGVIELPVLGRVYWCAFCSVFARMRHVLLLPKSVKKTKNIHQSNHSHHVVGQSKCQKLGKIFTGPTYKLQVNF